VTTPVISLDPDYAKPVRGKLLFHQRQVASFP
jgi:hypothetical protein